MSDNTWLEKPFDPDCSTRVEIDEATISEVREVIEDWDGENWEAVEAALKKEGLTQDDLRELTVFKIRMTFAARKKSMLQLCGVYGTHRPPIGDPIDWVVVPKGSVGEDGRPGASTSSDEAIKQLEDETPPLNTDDGSWVKLKLAADLEGLETSTLKKYRGDGVRNGKQDLGRDPNGRVWRRKGTLSSHPWYLKSSLKSERARQKGR